MTFHILRDETPDTALRRISREQLGIVLQNCKDAALDSHAKIHSLRARCKKMRALLRLPGPVMGDTFAAEDERYRNAGRYLGVVRDEYVQRRMLAELLDDEAWQPPPADDTASLPDALLLIRDGFDAIDGWPWLGAGFYDLAPGYARTFSKGRLAWQRVLRDRSDEHFHKLRKWSKYLWYQTRILERMNRKSLHVQRVRLQVLGELLGHAHDLAILETGMHVPIDAATRRLAANRKHRFYMRALKLCTSVYEPTADEQTANLARWWQTWRQPLR